MTNLKAAKPLKRNKAFELLGTRPRNARWSWCATSPKEDLAIFTLWENEIRNNRNLLLTKNDLSRDGGRDQKRVLDLVMANNIPAYGLICIPVDPKAKDLKLKEARREYLVRLKIEVKKNGDIWGIHQKRVLFEDMAKEQRSNNGLDDLGRPPEGTDAPDRAKRAGFSVSRIPAVRSYVINRAKGRCELCNKLGFTMANGQRYLEAHHIIALACKGPDTVYNVIALCPEHHRRAHFGSNAEKLEAKFIKIVRKKQILLDC